MIPHERSLVEKYKDEPFAIIGVNSDTDLVKTKEQRAKTNVTWRSFWNGEKGTSGPISTEWGVTGWPTIYILDAKGVIRYKSVGADEKAFDQTIEDLLAEAKKSSGEAK